MSSQAPVLFIPHGGGPMPLLGDPAHQSLTAFLSSVAQKYPAPKAILVISAHWEEEQPTLLTNTLPALFFDYYGFPSESYQFCYPASNPKALQKAVGSALEAASIHFESDSDRGYDHGVFVPLLLMHPQPTIPVLQLSLMKNLDPSQHLRLGKALAPLRESGVMILGSGLSFHNMQVFRGGLGNEGLESEAFHDWLVDVLHNPELTRQQRLEQLASWQKAPQARFCHPREEHLLPLHVCLGAAQGDAADIVFDDAVFGQRTLGALWH